MSLNLSSITNNDNLNSTLENINHTLLTIKQEISSRNTSPQEAISSDSNDLRQIQQTREQLSLSSKNQSEEILNMFNSVFDQASNTLKQFSDTSKNDILSLSSFISESLSSINLKDFFSDPLSLLGQGLSNFFMFKAHSGGMVNDMALPFQSDEVPIIAKRGEAIFTPQQMDNADALIQNSMKSGTSVNINVHNNANVAVEAKHSSNENNQTNIDIIINEAENLMSRRISMGSGLASAFENRYGLSPRPRG